MATVGISRTARSAPRAASLLLTALWLVSSTARAGTFSEEGAFAFDEAAADSFDFEDGVPPQPNPDDPPLVRSKSSSALSGQWVIELPPFTSADLEVELPADKRAYRVSLWVRGNDVTGYFVIRHGTDQPPGELATLYPTGRITSDGWVELANEGIRFDGARSSGLIGVFSPGGCELDAVEIIPTEQLADEVNTSCEGITDGTACGDSQVCYWSECRNVNGWVPPIPENREDATAYLANRLRFMFGPFRNRTLDMPAAMGAVQAMYTATTPWEYWNGYLSAVRRLHDGHTSTSGLADFVIQNPRPLNVCFIEGDADLSKSTAASDPEYLDVLVSHVGPDHALGLKAGDRLVSIDGYHPIAWSLALRDQVWAVPSISNHSTFAEHAARLRSAIARFAHEIVVIRCDQSTNSCGAPETINVSDIPFDPPGTNVDIYSCDNRPLRHVADAPQNHGGGFNAVFSGIANESNATEKIYAVEWQSLSTTNGSNGVGAALKGALSGITVGGGNGAILDHRDGGGGTFLGPTIVWDWATPPHVVSYTQTRQRAEDEQPSIATGLGLFNAAVSGGDALYGGSTTATTIPVALLITQDVSASDWLPLGLKGAAPNVRIFGPYQTNGAFSTRFQYSYWLGMTTVLATGDTFVPGGYTQAGLGIEPDETVLPKQSDLVAGVDTVFEAALAWIRQEMTP